MGLFQSAIWRGGEGRGVGGGNGDDGGQVIMNENVCGYEITVGQVEEERINLACSGRKHACTDRQTDTVR